jgi:hypothetical protein
MAPGCHGGCNLRARPWGVQVDWKAPRPPGEFLSKFSPPKNTSKWVSRVKCNVYYYRTNYVFLLAVSFVFSFLRNPLALVALKIASLALLCLNDPFATGLRCAWCCGTPCSQLWQLH